MHDSDILADVRSHSAATQHLPDLPHRILVVDDDLAIRQLNAKILLRSGYKVEAAADGDAAWQALTSGTYDLVITDHKMPKVTGVELLRKLRAARMALPVIMVTGAMPSEEFKRNPWLLPTATLLKPYAPEELLEKVQEVLRATESTGAPWIAPPSDWQDQPPANGQQP